jgi:phage N-6-adenine-methyltransferase
MKGKDSVHFSSGSDCWATPQEFFDELNREFVFTLDVCALPETAKCSVYCIPPTGAEYHILWPGEPLRDGLFQDWSHEVCWMNPPYSQLGLWMSKAEHATKNGATVVCLIPSRTDTKAWHTYVWDQEKHQPRPGVEVRFVKGRLKFGGCDYSAPFPSVVVIFRPTDTEPEHGCFIVKL